MQTQISDVTKFTSLTDGASLSRNQFIVRGCFVILKCQN